MLGFIQDFGILFLITVAISFLIKLIKQPIIVGYVLSGFLFSYMFIQQKASEQQIIILSELGITFMLFLIGLEFDLKSLKYLGKDIFITSILQSVTFFLLAFGLASIFNFSLIEKVYLSILFMFSSTLLVTKWIEDKKDMNTLHGKVIIGTLIIQDIFAIIALTLLNIFQQKSPLSIIMVPLEGLLLLLIAFVLSKFVLNHLLKIASRFPELLFIFSLGICFFFVEIAPILGYSTTLGAFIAGITLANTIYRQEISSNLKPLIKFFNMLFFVGMGFQISLNFNYNHIIFIILLVVLCMIIKPLIVYLTLRYRGYDTKTSFMAGIYLAQLSEFGIIIVAAGVFGGLINNLINTITVFSVIVTMVISSYILKSDKELYILFEKYLMKFDKRILAKNADKEEIRDISCNILLIGYYELGQELYSQLKSLGKSIVVIENNPENIYLLKREDIDYVYGSVGNPDFFSNTIFRDLELVISNTSDIEINKKIIAELKNRHPKIIVIVTAKTLKESIELYNNNADYVIYQTYLQEQQVSALIEDYTTDIHKVITKKVNDMMKLKEKEARNQKLYEKKNAFFDIDVFLNRITSKR